MMIETAKSGPNQDTPALITAIESVPASINTFAGRNFNYLQLRTAAGGMEAGTISIDARVTSNTTATGRSGCSAKACSMEAASRPLRCRKTPRETSSRSPIAEDRTTTRSARRVDFFAVDTGNGTILSLPKAATKSFDATTAGTYTAIYYEKANAQTGQSNVETGTPTEGKVTITDSQNHVMATGTLTAVADTSYLYDGTASELSDPFCGMFTFRATTASSQQDVFASFQGNAVISSSFATGLPVAGYAPYT
jgi:hypothetical protein